MNKKRQFLEEVKKMDKEELLKMKKEMILELVKMRAKDTSYKRGGMTIPNLRKNIARINQLL